jgi:SAM-dependent methyltransferase
MRYHEVLLAAVPRPCHRALDVGCGEGAFARRLALVAGRVDAVDRVPQAAFPREQGNLRFIEADFERWEPEPHAYDFVSAIASLHHMALEPAVAKMKRALAPGGVLGIIGLYRRDPLSVLLSAVAFPLSWPWHGAPMRAPTREPSATLTEIRRVLGPGVKRRLFWRYTFIGNSPHVG